MNERLIKLRKFLHITQQEFADRLKISRSTVATYEVGKSNPSDAAVSLICREFNVNEEWLRTGNGEMFLPVDRENEIAKMVKSLLSEETNTFKSRFIAMLAGLSVSDWERLEMEARKLLGNNTELELAATNSKQLKPKIKEKLELYEPSLAERVAAAEAEYIKSRSKSAKKKELNVLSTTEGIIETDNDIYKVSNQ